MREGAGCRAWAAHFALAVIRIKIVGFEVVRNGKRAYVQLHFL